MARNNRSIHAFVAARELNRSQVPAIARHQHIIRQCDAGWLFLASPRVRKLFSRTDLAAESRRLQALEYYASERLYEELGSREAHIYLYGEDDYHEHIEAKYGHLVTE